MAISPRPLDGAPDVEQDLQTVLEWLRAQYAGGRAKIYAPLVLCREIFGTGGQCDPRSWARLWRVLPLLLERGLIEEVALPQGDPGVRLSPRGA